VDVSKIARIRGGGGHVGAAGFTSDETIPEIVEFLRASVT
jgi:nanoRNase/pAp phosphatase (c-di-AMP/oligoRNAs hydrolase)